MELVSEARAVLRTADETMTAWVAATTGTMRVVEYMVGQLVE